MHQGNPGAWNQSGGHANYNVSSHILSEPNLGYGPAHCQYCFNSEQVRAQWYNHSPNPVSKYEGSASPTPQRGGRWYGSITSYGSRHTGGRRLGSRGRGSVMNSSF